MADTAAEPVGGSRALNPGIRPRAWYSPTQGYIVWTRHPLLPCMIHKCVADGRLLMELPADAAEFILKEPWRRFPTDNP